MKHFITIPILVVVFFFLGWFSRPVVETFLKSSKTLGETENYQGFDFSFEYPVSYTASEDGLWTKDRYEFSLNPPENSDTASLPDIKLINETFVGTVKEYFETTLKVQFDEVTNPTLSFEEITADNTNGSKYYKIVDHEMLKQVYYVKQNGNRIVGFETFNTEEGHEPEILAMLKSLTFK